MRAFLKIERYVTATALAVSMVFLVIAASLAMYQVTTRFIFGQPSTWSEVITRSAMIWAVFMGIAGTYRHGSMIAMEIIQRALPPKLGLGLYFAANALSALFFAILFWQGIGMAERVINQRLAALEISIAWVYVALPMGSAFALVAILGCVVRAAIAGKPDAAVVPMAYAEERA